MRRLLSATAVIVTPVYLALKATVASAGAIATYWMLLLSFDPALARTTLDITGSGDWQLQASHMTCEQPIRLISSSLDGDAGPSPSADVPANP
jgi:hypothetical protein